MAMSGGLQSPNATAGEVDQCAANGTGDAVLQQCETVVGQLFFCTVAARRLCVLVCRTSNFEPSGLFVVAWVR